MPPTILARVSDAGEVLVTLPDGRMIFMNFWSAVVFCCRAVFRGYRVKVEDRPNDRR